MNMISSSTAPYLLYSELSGKPKQTYGNRFSDALEKEKAENNITESAAEIAVNEMDKARKGSTEPSYTVTEDEAEYFREKYGEDYNYENRFKLFSELSEKNIISYEDSYVASRKNPIVRITGLLPPPEVMDRAIAKYGYCKFKLNAPIPWINSEYGNSYEKYKEQHNMSINTWQDYVQDNYNYYQYIRDTHDLLYNNDGSTFTSEFKKSFDKYCEITLKVQEVLNQIFG